MLIPRALREDLGKGYHDLPASGHQGVDRTKLEIQHGMSRYMIQSIACGCQSSAVAAFYLKYMDSGHV